MGTFSLSSFGGRRSCCTAGRGEEASTWDGGCTAAQHSYIDDMSVSGASRHRSQGGSEATTINQIEGLVQKRRNSSALAMELRLSCTNPSKWACNLSRYSGMCFYFQWTLQLISFPGPILGLRPANETRRYIVTTSHWLKANLESVLILNAPEWRTWCFVMVILWLLYSYYIVWVKGDFKRSEPLFTEKTLALQV